MNKGRNSKSYKLNYVEKDVNLNQTLSYFEKKNTFKRYVEPKANTSTVTLTTIYRDPKDKEGEYKQTDQIKSNKDLDLKSERKIRHKKEKYIPV